MCVLDTGVNRGHPLLEHALAPADLHAVDPGWGTNDHEGHGTEMAGLALLGELGAAFATVGPVRVRHRLESVKLVPPVGQNDPQLYGAITAEAVARAEVQAPTRRRAFSMSITAGDGRERGQPTSWSAAIDALAAGRSFEPSTRGLTYLETAGEVPHRLFLVSAGNVDSTDLDHIARSDVEAIQDPAQAWNALTVGACTDLVYIDENDPGLHGWAPVARAGDLSPYSATSVPFATSWPLKPDVVFEGGNKGSDGHHAFQVDSLSLVTTNFEPQKALLRPTWATSAATAQVARFAADLAAEYPTCGRKPSVPSSPTPRSGPSGCSGEDLGPRVDVNVSDSFSAASASAFRAWSVRGT
ncbi:MAG: S8 family peptidase, partial [Gemmatimonadaceae bacterium]